VRNLGGPLTDEAGGKLRTIRSIRERCQLEAPAVTLLIGLTSSCRSRGGGDAHPLPQFQLCPDLEGAPADTLNH